MTIKVKIIRGDNIEFEELLQITFKIRKQDLLDKGIAFEDLATIFRENFTNRSIYYVIAYENEAIVGWLLLYPITDATLEINVGETLGGNPLVAPTYDWDELASNLLTAAKKLAKKQGYKSIEISVRQNEVGEMTSPSNSLTLFQSLGFKTKLKYVEMVYDVNLNDTPELILPKELSMRLINKFDEIDIYQCYISSFESGDAKFFAYQTKNERLDYFHTLYEPDILNREASIVLIKDNTIIGFSYVLEFEENSKHINCMCIHPDFQGKGLGELLLYKIINVVSKQGAKYITLGTEIEMGAFHLYKNNGFTVSEGTMILRWE